MVHPEVTRETPSRYDAMTGDPRNQPEDAKLWAATTGELNMIFHPSITWRG